MVARKGAYKYQSRVTRTLASASSLPPLQQHRGGTREVQLRRCHTTDEGRLGGGWGGQEALTAA